MKRTWSQMQEYGELGIIESVNIRNFMCHDNLSLDFDPHMNFIIGRNGSGKSAVLTAIILALGGKSGATGRHSNIKHFIKTGKNSALVSVALKNCGSEAYKSDEYGKKIIVERHFNSEGNSSYKLKSEAGRIVSTSKEELINILTVMDIQIENPIIVLNQDISKTFLVSKTSKADKLFQLFYKGTGLAKVHEDYNRALQQKQEAKSELVSKKAILSEMEIDTKKIKSIIDKSSKITELKTELLWAMVFEFEKKRDETREALEKKKKEYSELEKELNTCKTELVNVSQTLSVAKADRKISNEKMDVIRKDMHDLTEKKSVLNSEIRQIQGRYLSHEREVKRFTKEISSLKNIIDDIIQKNQNDLNEDKLKHEMALIEMNNFISNTNTKINTLEMKIKSYRESYTNMQIKKDACHAEIQEVNYEMNNIMREKQRLIDGLANRINVFGPEMVKVLQEIHQAVQSRLFKVEPKGPIGLYINVKQPQWTFAVQECLKSSFLKTFLCDNHADTDYLTRILKKHYQRNAPSIITTKFVTEVYDVTPHKTESDDHPTVLDMLDITDPVIMNCLIDQNHIENILLIADQREALNLMLYNPPRKCYVAYTPNGDQYWPSPFRSFSCRNSNQICMLKTVNKEDIRNKDKELKALDRTKSVKLGDMENLEQQLRQNEQETKKIDNEITNLKIKLNDVRMKLRDEENSYEEPKDINCLQSDMEQLEKEKKHHEEQLISCESNITIKTQELHSLNKSIDEFGGILKLELQNFQHLSRKVDECQNKTEKLDSRIMKIKHQLKQIEPDLKKIEDELSNDIVTVETAKRNASDLGACINTKRSPDAIRQILKETENFIQQQRNCDQESLVNEYQEKMQTLKKAKYELERQENINARLDKMLSTRFQEFQKICNNTSVSLNCCFIALLKESKFSGYLEINFEKQTLEILAKTEETNLKLRNKPNLSQFSGGERSYITIAFLLSLWDRIRTPFRILDEYDVFMDSNNRHRSINLLINSAKTNKKIQYIFLSPLELPHIEDSDHVKVHKMPEPRK